MNVDLLGISLGFRWDIEPTVGVYPLVFNPTGNGFSVLCIELLICTNLWIIEPKESLSHQPHLISAGCSQFMDFMGSMLMN